MGEFKKISSILYVEDEKKVQEELAEVLENFCEKLYVADHGKMGLEAFKKYKPDIVITDIKMPIMDGIEMSKNIKNINNDANIIFTTAFSDVAFMQEAINLHSDGYVTKPIDLDQLEKTINKSISTIHLKKELDYKTEQELKQKAELEKILSTTKDGIAILDLNLTYLYANEAYQEMLGFTLEELQQRTSLSLVAPQELENCSKAFKQLIQQGHINNFEKQCIRADKKIITVSMSAALMPDKHKLLLATRDITQQRHTTNILEDYLKLVDENIITSTTDLEGNITYASKAFCKISGYTQEELIGKSHNIVRHEDMIEETYEKLWETISNDDTWEGELRNKNKKGETYWVHAKIYPVYDEFHHKNGYTAIRQDITDLKKVKELSIKDGLTGIYNRRYFDEKLPKYINSSKRNNELISFAILDIDFFKQYNDTYGHQKGDDVLIKVSNSISDLLHRSEDYFFRLGGEEFGLLFKTKTKEQSLAYVNKIRQTIEELKIPHEKSTVSKYVTISIGLVSITADSIADSALLYKNADDLLYKAKKEGRNRVCANISSELKR